MPGSGHVRVRGAVVSVLPEQVLLRGHRLGGQVVHSLGERLLLLGTGEVGERPTGLGRFCPTHSG